MSKRVSKYSPVCPVCGKKGCCDICAKAEAKQDSRTLLPEVNYKD